MGIQGLNKLIAPAGKLVSYHDFNNRYVVVDAFQKIYRYCITP